MVLIRSATAQDDAFLQEMLAIAADWRPGASVRSIREILSEPTLSHYIAGWPIAGDVGVVAEEEGHVGAAWWRFIGGDDPGYGFVDESVPELTVAVIPRARRRGVGARLLEALIDEARSRGLAKLSLSVEGDNPAVSLYQRLGFVTVGRTSGSFTMVVTVES